MFITSKERNGTCYLEFQFCTKKFPIKLNKVDTRFINHWKEDSLIISDEDFENFFELFGNILNCSLLPNGKREFDYYGINYYDKESTEKILFELKNSMDSKYSNLIDWLEEVIKKYNGFYILGI